MLNALIASGGADLDYAALGTVLFALSGSRVDAVHADAPKLAT